MSSSTLLLIDIGIYITYALFGIAALGALFSGVRGMMTNPKNSKMALFGLVGIVVVFAISMGLSSGTDVNELLFEKTGTPISWSRWVGAGLISFYILFVCVIVTVVAAEVIKPSKK
jgi:H+/Cl- antiporter ClcA